VGAREVEAGALHPLEPPEGVPSGLLGGYVGFLGYECKADCGSPNVHRSDVPDAVLMLANRVVATDHITHRTHLLALCQGAEPEAEAWLDEAEQITRDLLAESPETQAPTPPAIARSSPWTSEEHLQHTLGGINSTLRVLALRGEPGVEEELVELRRLIGEALAALPEG
jgi:anthranilate/para-aminobenzoate synthase component I